LEVALAGLDACQLLVLAEAVRRGRCPEAWFGSTLSVREATRRTQAAVALSEGSLPGAVVLGTVERLMDELFKADHPDRSDTKLELPPYGERMAQALSELCHRLHRQPPRPTHLQTHQPRATVKRRERAPRSSIRCRKSVA
jgi:hypothetical protein